MSDLTAQLSDWIDSLRDDIDAVKVALETQSADIKARQYAAGALNYVVARMDLVPDWTAEIGLLDDVMVLRICLDLANDYGLLDTVEDPDTLVRAGRMLNDIEQVEQILGEGLYARLRDYCKRLALEEVRGRTPRHVVEEADMRAALYKDLERDIARVPTPRFADVDHALVQFRSYLHAKLS